MPEIEVFTQSDLIALNFRATQALESAYEPVQLRIIEVYRDSQLSVMNKIQRLQNTLDPGRLPEIERLEALKISINRDIVTMQNLGENASRAGRRIGTAKAKSVTLQSTGVAPGAYNTFLSKDVLPYLKTNGWTARYPKSVKTYGDLTTFFQRSDYKYFEQLNKNFGGQVKGLLDITWQKNKEDILKAIADLEKAGLKWKPLEALQKEIRRGVTERLSYGQTVTAIRRNVFKLPKGARNPGITYRATRIARTELMNSAYLGQDAFGFETPGITGRYVNFGGGACDGRCLQFVGFWPYNGDPPPEIPFHPHCGCYITFETRDPSQVKQQKQEVYKLKDGRYADKRTWDHNQAKAEILRKREVDNKIANWRARQGERLTTKVKATELSELKTKWREIAFNRNPDLSRRTELLSLQGSNRFPEPLERAALKVNLASRFTLIRKLAN